MSLPIIDASGLLAGELAVADRIARACEEDGFFYVVAHGVDPRPLEALARRFFALPLEDKQQIAMARGGRAWRGYFPVGGEYTSGVADQKEGLYFGEELPLDHPRVRAGTPLFGPNLWPAQVPELEGATLAYMRALERVAQALLRGISGALGLPAEHIYARYTEEPIALFRIFHYPPTEGEGWGVGEHTDYGLLTLLAQDGAGGLEVKTRKHGWQTAPPIEGALVANIGDMLDKLTGGRFRSTPHRVRNRSGRARVSMPYFFDPGWDARLEPLVAGASDRERWDGADVHAFEGTYGDYLTTKVARVFPDLAAAMAL